MSIEKDQTEAAVADDPIANQALWDEIEAEERGDAAPPAQEPGTDNAAATAAAPEPAVQADSAAADPYADLPKVVRDEILGLKATVEQLGGRVRNAEGNIGGLKTQLQRDLSDAAKATAKAGADAPNPQQLADASKSPSALARLVDDYPEFGAAVKEVVDAQAQEIAGLKQALSRQPQQDPDREQLKSQIVDLTIRTRHPNWKTEVVAADFAPWVKTQPREVQALYVSDNPDDVIRLLDIRTAAAAAKRAAEQNQDQGLAKRKAAMTRAAAVPSGRSAAAIHAKDVDAMEPDEYWRHLDAIEAGK